MNPSTNSGDTCIHVEFPGRRVSFSDQHNQLSNPATVPLLLQPVYARSKSSIYDELRNFQISLKWCALDHSSCTGKLISYFSFIILTIIVPVASSLFVRVPASAPANDPICFNKLVQLPESGLATIGFFTLSGFFSRYGLRQLLFLDGLHEDSPYVRHGYTRELETAFRYLACILLPSFLVELAHKIMFFSTVEVSIPYVNAEIPLNLIIFIVMLASWVYRTGVFLLVCVLFRLTCELQILRFEGIYKLLEGCGSDAGVIFREHVRIKRQLSVTSHQYRFFIIGCLVTINVSQLGALLLVLATKSEKSFFNSGDVVVYSAVQLSGFFLCLFGAARITHRAQRIASIGTRWNMIVTCASNTGSNTSKDLTPAENGMPASNNCGGDSESSDNFVTVSSQDSSSFQARQALVAYLQHNNGGITLFGFALDRGLLHTLFAFEFSLVLWILSRVVVLS